MGKTTGFLEFDRCVNGAIEPLERIKNFDEFRKPLNEEERVKQASRCMNCGVPFCQSGMTLNGMATGCPLNNLIPEWNDEIYNGHWEEALSRLLKTNNFPEFTGRVCPALCEAACTCGLNGESVSVHDNELAIIENGFESGYLKPNIPKLRSEKKVAVIGSGPAGLAVADQLNKRGHSVIVYEKSDTPGGLLTYGIPNMKLDKKIVARRIELMKKEGVTFIVNSDIGANVSADEIKNSFDAVVLCCGAKKARDLKGEGRDADGIYFAVDFLTSATKCVIGKEKEFSISAKNKNVVIVGGGDTGNDCVGTSIRQGCKSVVQLEMMPKLPDERQPENPWPQWKRVCKTDYGQQEAIAVFGKDPRVYQRTVKRFLKDENGKLSGIETIGLEMKKDAATGRAFPQEVIGSEEILPCELLLIAAGFVGCDDYLAESFGLAKDARGNINVSVGLHCTDRDGVFAAGDVRRGQSLVVHAIADGRACAKEVDEYLMGYGC